MEEQAAAIGVTVLLVFSLAFLLIYIIPVWRIVSKAGFSGALSLLMLIPFVNIIFLWIFAFTKWPVEESNT